MTEEIRQKLTGAVIGLARTCENNEKTESTDRVFLYLFTGFLEAGKTKFIQETLEDKRFNNGEPTLLLVCEEGIEEYEPEEFSI